jgi:hypothetical protein
MTKEKSFVFILAIIVNTSLFGQKDTSTIFFDASLRERFESWNGMNARNYGDPNGVGNLNDNILFQRVIAGFNYTPNNKITISAHLQDSRAFGWSLRNAGYPDLFKIKAKNTQEPYYIMNPNEEFYEIHDLYLEYRDLLKNITIKAGRQKVSYGDNRVFGPGEWGNTGRWTWDALKISYKKRSNFIDIFCGGTKIHDPEKVSIPFTKTEFRGGGLYAHYEWSKIMTVEPFYAIKREGSADYSNELDFTRQWVGVRLLNNDFHHFVYDFTLNKEFGNESGKSIDAFGILAKLGYQFNFVPAEPILAIRESYASGGKNTDNKINTFDPVYGSKDQYYGRMNITSWSNLDDREIFVTLFPVKNMKIEMNYHWFYTPVPEDVTLLTTVKLKKGKHHLGNEFDIFANYQILKQLQFITAFGYFKPGDIQPINTHESKYATWFALQILYEMKFSN